MHLEGLAPELISLILQNIDSPRSLHDLIAASPACLRVFSQTSQLTLASVIRNTLPIETIRYFLPVLHTPSPATSTAVSLFLERYFNNPSSFEFPIAKADLIPLYQLYNRVTYIINRYLRRLQDLGLGDSILEPSPSERIRLQRAFLRFEVYSRVFPSDDTRPWETPSPHHQFSATEQFNLFLSHLAPWEAEEMACVEMYFSLVIGGFVDELENQFIDAVKRTPGLVWLSSPESNDTETRKQASPTEKQDDLWAVKSLDLTSLALFSEDEAFRSPEIISYMTSLGLEFICNLCTLESRRSEFIRSNSPFTRQFLPQALKESRPFMMGRQHEVAYLKEFREGDDPSYGNLGYYQEIKTPDEVFGYISIGFIPSHQSARRQLGYVFWDSKRIQSSEVSGELLWAKKMTSRQLDHEFDRRNRKCAEERLKGAMVPLEQFEKLEKDFGSIRRPVPWEIENQN